jgi:hypothetical protein
MNQSFEFNNLPCEIKNIIFQTNRDEATRQRDMRLHHAFTTDIRNELFYAIDLARKRPLSSRGTAYKLWRNLRRNSKRHPQHTKIHRSQFRDNFRKKFC